MANIRVLPSEIANKIAAGEVAERPSAVVKELVENSIDAGADRITVEVKNGGISYIRVEDNGKGIAYDELESAFLRHATSKLRDIDDLYEIRTMGFRGEALASICAVADVEAISRTDSEEEGGYIRLSGGKTVEKDNIACNKGTTIIVENLFANVPARMKFLKKDSTEAGYIGDVLGRIALSKPEISFSYICDGKEQFSTTGDGHLKNAVLNIYGIECAKGVLEVDYQEHGIRVSGVCGKSELARGNRMRQTLFVNGRYIKNHVVSKVIEEAYRNILMTGRFPFFILNIELAPELVDVNVHPAKTEIKLANEKEVYDIVHRGVKNALYGTRTVAEAPQTAPRAERVVEKSSDLQTEKGKITMPFDGINHTAASGFAKPDQKEIRQYMGGIFTDNTPKADAFNEDTSIYKYRGYETSAADNGNKMPAEEITETEKAPVFDLFSEKVKDGNILTEMKVVGQVFDTYIAAWSGDKMYLIDQHAAHERKRFEALKEAYEKAGISGQILMEPIVMSADSNEIQLICDSKSDFDRLGFNIEEFGRGAVIIRETPIAADDEAIKALVLEIVSVFNDARPKGLLSYEERALDMIACRYAIKANKRLNILEMEAVLRDTQELLDKGISTCPHGRPIRIEFTKKEIEKLFKRIV